MKPKPTPEIASLGRRHPKAGPKCKVCYGTGYIHKTVEGLRGLFGRLEKCGCTEKAVGG